MDYKSLLFWILLCHLQNITVALNCYMCPATGADTVEDANIECLALGWEISCSPQEDRCFSKTYLDNKHVEKGCTGSENCVGTTSCCQGQYCNGDPLTSLTGYGQPCNDLSNCIQRSEVMRCAREVSGDITKRCLCTDDSYRRGSTCKRKSFPDERCTITSHCSDVNTTCVSGVCLCADGMYPNVSICDLRYFEEKPLMLVKTISGILGSEGFKVNFDDQDIRTTSIFPEIEVGLGYNCIVNKQCGGLNTQCAGEKCACAYGYDVINGTDSCSGIPPQHPQLSHHIGTWTTTFLLIAGMNVINYQ